MVNEARRLPSEQTQNAFSKPGTDSPHLPPSARRPAGDYAMARTLAADLQ